VAENLSLFLRVGESPRLRLLAEKGCPLMNSNLHNLTFEHDDCAGGSLRLSSSKPAPFASETEFAKGAIGGINSDEANFPLASFTDGVIGRWKLAFSIRSR